jgi:hypothetical protein
LKKTELFQGWKWSLSPDHSVNVTKLWIIFGMEKWEYMMVGVAVPIDLTRLNKLGDEGWEVISMVVYTAQEFRFILKRRKS